MISHKMVDVAPMKPLLSTKLRANNKITPNSKKIVVNTGLSVTEAPIKVTIINNAMKTKLAP